MLIFLPHSANIFWSVQSLHALKYLGSHMKSRGLYDASLQDLGFYPISKVSQAHGSDSWGFRRKIFGSVFFPIYRNTKQVNF